MKIIRLQPKGYYKTSLTSDTLFGIICWGIHVLYGAEILEDLLGRFDEGDPPFIISHSFPYIRKDGEFIYFFPRPTIPPITGKMSGENLDKFKQFKKIQWLPYSVFRKMQTGEWTENDYFNSGAWEKMPKPTLREEIQMHNSINRMTGTTGKGNLFYTPYYYIPDGGLYFFLSVRDGNVWDYIMAAFRLFSHLGVGGDASIGKGYFIPEADEFPHDLDVKDPNARIILSYYYPTADEAEYYYQKPDLTWYRLEKRKGKVGGIIYPTGQTWKKSIHIFHPGSVFPAIPEKEIYGTFPVVKDPSDGIPFPIYFPGYPLMLEFKLQEKKE